MAAWWGSKGFAALLTLAGCVALSGCGRGGPKFYPVTGKVLVDGHPAEHALVVFHPVNAGPDALKPHAAVGPDGTFTLTTNTTGDGAPAGEYLVTVEWWLSGVKKVSDPDVPSKNHLPAKYAKPESSGLKRSEERRVGKEGRAR